MSDDVTHTATIDARPRDVPRIPPGQVRTAKWPVLHYGDVPAVDPAAWRFEVTGLVTTPFRLSLDELRAMPTQDMVCDIHCVTRWSRLDNQFTGVSVQALLRRAGPTADAAFVLVKAAQGFTTNLPLADFDRPENLLAWAHDGAPLSAEHGGPVRLVVPHLYFWKSAKWVTGIELRRSDAPGFWEQNGYHDHGDPWREERHQPSGFAQWMVNSLRNESKKRGGRD
ncbi:sulfite oxidase-like oxidoreductase [Gemmatimonadetes bacterium T265]|nr:sulfite oxidase-like oxidoreductase [Gemmatimonadetes bacterium T265]